MKNLIISILTLFVVNLVQAQKFKGLDKSPLDMIEFPENRGEKNGPEYYIVVLNLRGEHMNL